jgi:hypothetical protein
MDKQNEKIDELMKKVNEFESTVKALLENIRTFKVKIQENIKKFGLDASKWPEMKA